ncbi:MAG: glycosyltransferase family 4 protein [Bacteroidia bacterium]|jgi:glycosyltransferase involved in cell wall biosynthesis
MKKVLIITYYWPPSGGAGVQRWLKFVKYLPEFGIEPIVLTVDSEQAAYPVRDASLENDVSENVKVFRTPCTDYFKFYRIFSGKKELPTGGISSDGKSSLKQKIMGFVRGNLLIPDPRRGWNSYAYQKAVELIREQGIDTVVTTSPPHSTQLIGLKLKKNLGIRWIADLRDPWTDIYYYKQFYHTAIAKAIDKAYERKVVENADALVTVSADLARIYSGKTTTQVQNKIHVIPNGFDESDFPRELYTQEDEPVIAYTGTLSDEYDISGFIQAMKHNASGLALRFVGKVSPAQQHLLEDLPIKPEYIAHVPHQASIQHLMKARILLLVIPKVANNRGILTGKFFEYLASGKPILAIGPTDGDLADIIRSIYCGAIFDYSDWEGIEAFVRQNADKGKNLKPRIGSEMYSRRSLTKMLAYVLNVLEER